MVAHVPREAAIAAADVHQEDSVAVAVVRQEAVQVADVHPVAVLHADEQTDEMIEQCSIG